MTRKELQRNAGAAQKLRRPLAQRFDRERSGDEEDSLWRRGQIDPVFFMCSKRFVASEVAGHSEFIGGRNVRGCTKMRHLVTSYSEVHVYVYLGL